MQFVDDEQHAVGGTESVVTSVGFVQCDRKAVIAGNHLELRLEPIHLMRRSFTRANTHNIIFLDWVPVPEVELPPHTFPFPETMVWFCQCGTCVPNLGLDIISRRDVYLFTFSHWAF